MKGNFIKIRFNLHCEWDGFEPEYRVFVNNELFTERTYSIKSPKYYKEMLQVEGPPGRYTIRVEPVPLHYNNFVISNTHIECGNGKIYSDTEFEIHP